MQPNALKRSGSRPAIGESCIETTKFRPTDLMVELPELDQVSRSKQLLVSKLDICQVGAGQC